MRAKSKVKVWPQPGQAGEWIWGLLLITLAAALLLVGGCSSVTSSFSEAPSGPRLYEDPSSPGSLASLGFGSQDIIGLTDEMIRDIMAHTFWQRKGAPIKVAMDLNCIVNQGAGGLNLRLITDRLRIELNRAAQGRIIFVAPFLYQKRLHMDDLYGRNLSKRGLYPHAAEYRLCGNITSLDLQSANSGVLSRYTQVGLELVEAKSAQVVWGKIYSFRKRAARWDLDPKSAQSLAVRPQPPRWGSSQNADPFESLTSW